MADSDFASKLLCIVPPYRHRNCPPAGAAALLGHLKAAGVTGLRFLDLRTITPETQSPTFDPVGVFAESFVIDVPDLPLVLQVLRAFEDGTENFPQGSRTEAFDRYCLSRGIDPVWLYRYLGGVNELLTDVFEHMDSVSFVGFSVWASNLTTTLMAAAQLKRRRNPPFIVAGGPQVTESRASALLGLRAGLFDAVVLGEGEQALLTLITRLERGEPIADIPRVLSLHQTEVAPMKELRPLLRMNTLAEPDFGEMSLASYRSTDGSLRLPFQLSRGCTDRCTFCSEWVFWERFRPADIEHSLTQLEQLQRRYGISRFHFTDSLLNGNMRLLRSFAEGLLARNLAIDWGGFMRAQIDVETALLLRKAGCSYAYIGVESLSDETLVAMNKRRTRADNLSAIAAFLEAGILVSVGVIPGFPGDTRERFLATARELAALTAEYPGRFGYNIEPFVVSPAQPLFHDLTAAGLRAIPWDHETLQIAPRYRDLTESIVCRVEGANQGIERLGQLRLLEVLLGAQRGSASSSRSEELPCDRARFVDLGLGTLLLVKHRGRVTGRLVTAKEKSAIIQIVQSGHSSKGLFERDDFRREWQRITEQQAWLAHNRLLPEQTLASLEDAQALHLPDYVVGRLVPDAGAKSQLLVANVLHHACMALPPELATLLAALSQKPQTLVWTRRESVRCGMDPAAVDPWLQRMLANGLLCTVHATAQASDAKTLQPEPVGHPSPSR